MIFRAEVSIIVKKHSQLLIKERITKCVRVFLTVAVVITALLPLSVSALSVRLPDDEDDLVELLSARAIDSTEYEQLLAFYAVPLSVPRGELAYLLSVFPDLIETIPIDPEEISEYRPFDNRQIRRLFDDYPALEDFEPILRFNDDAAPEELNGEVVVGINRSKIGALRGHRVRFRRKGGLLSAEGGLALSDSGALWQSRRIDVKYKGVGVHIGNFKQPIPGELASGRFASLSSLTELTGLTDGTFRLRSMTAFRLRSMTAANWLYGGTGAWNGISVDIKDIWNNEAVGVGAVAFCHLRPAESGGGAGVNININKQAKVFAGVTTMSSRAKRSDPEGINTGIYNGIDTDISTDISTDINTEDANDGKNIITNEYYYAHLHAEYKLKNVRATAEAVMPLSEESFVPALSLRLNHSVKGASAEYHAIFYPADNKFPMSRLKKQLLTEIGEKEASSPSIQKHAVRITIPFISDAIKLIPEIDFVESDGVKRINGRAEARARFGSINIAAKHSAKIFATGADSALHTSGASINYQTVYPVAISASFQSAYGYYKNPRNTYSLEVPTTVIPSTVITPYVMGKYALTSEYRLGIKGEFHLYKKTWTGLMLEVPVKEKGDRDVYVKVSSSYSF